MQATASRVTWRKIRLECAADLSAENRLCPAPMSGVSPWSHMMLVNVGARSTSDTAVSIARGATCGILQQEAGIAHERLPEVVRMLPESAFAERFAVIPETTTSTVLFRRPESRSACTKRPSSASTDAADGPDSADVGLAGSKRGSEAPSRLPWHQVELFASCARRNLNSQEQLGSLRVAPSGARWRRRRCCYPWGMAARRSPRPFFPWE